MPAIGKGISPYFRMSASGGLSAPEFIMTIKTDNAGVTASDQFRIQTNTAVTDAVIDWGDGSGLEVWNVTANKTHTYPSVGTYQIKISGRFRPWFVGATDRRKIISLDNWGVSKWQNLENAFTDCTNMVGTFTDKPDLSVCTTVGGLFLGCTIFTAPPMNGWDLGAATSASAIFFNCINFNSSVTNWKLPNATNASFCFYGCVKFNQSIDTWTTPKLANMESMFEGCTIYNQPMNNLDVADVTNMKSVFRQCLAFNQPLNNWNVAKVINMETLFDNTVFNQNINSWTTTALTNMRGTFYRCLTYNQPLNNWDVSNVTTFRSCFERNIAFNQDITGWNVSKVITFDYMFYEATSFNQAIGTWTINTTGGANVTMEGMFASGAGRPSAFNQPIGGWNMTRVINVKDMFFENLVFNQNIGAWNIINCTNFTGFMTAKTPATFSSANLDAIYNGWSALVVQSGQTITFGSAKYTAGSAAGRAILTGTYTWSITDGGI